MTADEKKRLTTLEQGQAKILSKLELIYGEVKRTNGRVTKLEDHDEKAQKWQATHNEYTKNKSEIVARLAVDMEKLKASDNKSKGANTILFFFAGVAGAVVVALLQYFLMK